MMQMNATIFYPFASARRAMPYAERHKAVGLAHSLHQILAVICVIRVPPFRDNLFNPCHPCAKIIRGHSRNLRYSRSTLGVLQRHLHRLGLPGSRGERQHVAALGQGDFRVAGEGRTAHFASIQAVHGGGVVHARHAVNE